MKEETTSDAAWISVVDSDETVTCEFEDNFKPFNRMNDSGAYVASLENRLSKLKNNRKQPTGKEIIEALFLAKDDHVSHLLKEGINSNGLAPAEEDESHCNSVASETKIHSLLIGKIYPERQAVSSEELVHLLSSDKLNITKEAELSDQK